MYWRARVVTSCTVNILAGFWLARQTWVLVYAPVQWSKFRSSHRAPISKKSVVKWASKFAAQKVHFCSLKNSNNYPYKRCRQCVNWWHLGYFQRRSPGKIRGNTGEHFHRGHGPNHQVGASAGTGREHWRTSQCTLNNLMTRMLPIFSYNKINVML